MADAPSDLAKGEETKGLSETPVCLRCFTAFNPLQHFCQHCGQTVGQLTPYIPYVNIRFNYSIFGTMWQKLWFDKRTTFPGRILFFVLIVIIAPVMLLGLPLVLRMRHVKEMMNARSLLNVIIFICSLLLAGSYFSAIEPSWSPSDAWYGDYDGLEYLASESSVAEVDIFPYVAGIAILLVLTSSRWPKAGAFLIMLFSIAWLVSSVREELTVADYPSNRFPGLGVILTFFFAVPMLILAISMLLKFGTKARVLTLAAILAAAALLHQAYSIAWYLREDSLSQHMASVAGAAIASVIFVSLLIQIQMYLWSEEAGQEPEQSSE